MVGFAGVGRPYRRVLIVGELLQVLRVVGSRGCVESQCGVAGSLSQVLRDLSWLRENPKVGLDGRAAGGMSPSSADMS